MSELSTSDPFVGQLLEGRYRIVREIAVGGMSTVYEATHVKIGRIVAIKVLHKEMAGDAEVVARFLQEARAVGTFGHPNIVASTDFGELEGHVPYLVLEYLDGHTLSHDIRTNGPMPVRRAIRISLQIASALDAAHARGVVHRDLTSDNVFLIQSDGNPDHVKVLDFGISKFLTATDASPKTRRGLTMGTPEFMAPEQISDPESVDERADVYALGVVMHHMLAGQTPFGRLPLQALLMQIVSEPPPAIDRDEIPDGIRDIVTRALSKSPGERFFCMRDMATEIEHFSSMMFSTDGYSGRVVAPALGTGTGSRAYSSAQKMRTGSQSINTKGEPTGPVAAAEATGPAVGPAGRPPERSGGRRILFASIAILAAAAALTAAFLHIGPQGASAPGHESSAAPMAAAPPAAAPLPPSRAIDAPPVHLQVGSGTPLARVTLRGRIHSLPFASDVKPGSQPESMELTAPGHEGRRFWLTLDRPIAVSIDLPPGRGVIEMTEEETLVALGERPADQAPPEEASRSGGKHTGGASHHGAGGRSRPGSAKPAPAMAPAPAPAPRLVAAALVTPAAPASSAKAAPAPAPAPAKPQGITAPARVPSGGTPSPTAASPASSLSPTPALSHAPAAGTVDPVKTQAVVRGRLPEIQRCYERGKMDDPDLKGRVTVRITIAASGGVTATAIDSSSLGNSRVESCIASAVRGWKFPAPSGGGSAVISYPFNLR